MIHLGLNRSEQEVVDAALEKGTRGVAVSSYQDGHVEYFEHLVQSLRVQGAEHVQVVGGGGGVIVPEEIARAITGAELGELPGLSGEAAGRGHDTGRAGAGHRRNPAFPEVVAH